MSKVQGLPRRSLKSAIHPDQLSDHLELWMKACGLLYPNEKARIRIKGLKEGSIPLEIEIGLVKQAEEKEVIVKYYGGKKKKLRERDSVGEHTRTGQASGSSEPSET